MTSDEYPNLYGSDDLFREEFFTDECDYIGPRTYGDAERETIRRISAEQTMRALSSIRPATEETVIELREHSRRHRSLMTNGEGIRHFVAHAVAAAGLFLASKGHEFLDAADKKRGYR